MGVDQMVEGFLIFLKIMMINIVLSGDNAVVIAMASKNLPLEQRKKAVWWGAFAAVFLRIALTVVAVTLLEVPYIQAVGSLLLMYIAIKLLIDDDSHADVKQAVTLKGAIWTIMIADFVMSLDNVLAVAAAANGNYVMIVLGIGLSIPLIIWGSTIIMKLLHKYPILIFVGAAILGYTAGEMVMHDKVVADYLRSILPAFNWILPVSGVLIVIAFGWIRKTMVHKKKV